MFKKFEIYWPKNFPYFAIRWILDLSFYILREENQRGLKKNIVRLYLGENIETDEIPITQSLTRPKSLAERMIATITNTSINNESEIDKYLKQPAIIFTEDIEILK
ncbi:hypothetical protein BpHYR1_002667 [Brachionus plicatilis]|uniref:Uncharacterized protein n=1 Tax=Brachionus plicatilis TaxID=10195 RepID=A0A3M7RMC6_BRAPC|nr:hypothetical protein BpHYR1_002667 [Brachionus plicatilis]